MSHYFSVLLSRQHLLHPFMTPSDKENQSHGKKLKAIQLVASIALTILTTLSSFKLRLAGVGLGIGVFYVVTAAFKHQNMKNRCQKIADEVILQTGSQGSTENDSSTSTVATPIVKKLEDIKTDIQKPTEEVKEIVIVEKESPLPEQKSSIEENSQDSLGDDHQTIEENFTPVPPAQPIEEKLEQQTIIENTSTFHQSPSIIPQAIVHLAEDEQKPIEKEKKPPQNVESQIEIPKTIRLRNQQLNHLIAYLEEEHAFNESLLKQAPLSRTLEGTQKKKELKRRKEILRQEQLAEIEAYINREHVLDESLFTQPFIEDPVQQVTDKNLSTIQTVSTEEVAKSYNEKKLNYILQEILLTEKNFQHHVNSMSTVFEELQKKNVKEKLFQKYNTELQSALPAFQLFYKNLDVIMQNDLNIEERIKQLADLCCPLEKLSSYYDYLSKLILLNNEFNEFYLTKYQQVSKENQQLLDKLENERDPIIFFQRLVKHQLLIQELVKNYPNHSHLDQALEQIKNKANIINEIKRKQEIAELILSRNPNLKGEILKEEQRKEVYLIVTHRMYLDSTYQTVNQQIERAYKGLYRDILSDLFKQIEGLKVALVQADDSKKNEFKEQLSKLKSDLKAYLDYHSHFKKDDKIWQELKIWETRAKEILEHEALTCDKWDENYLKKALPIKLIQNLVFSFKLIKRNVDNCVEIKSKAKLDAIQQELERKLEQGSSVFTKEGREMTQYKDTLRKLNKSKA